MSIKKNIVFILILLLQFFAYICLRCFAQTRSWIVLHQQKSLSSALIFWPGGEMTNSRRRLQTAAGASAEAE